MSQRDRSSIARGFLFADLRGYSAYVERHGARAGAELLTAYRDIVRNVVPSFSGAEIRTEGDSFYVVFTSPSAALECGLAILDQASRTTTTRGTPIDVGIGVHAGETIQLDDAYVGSPVNIAARICSVAGAGQLLTSEAVRSLTSSYLEVTFVAVGRRRLKGITDPISIYRVLPGDAAPARRGIGLAAPQGLRRRVALIATGTAIGVAAIAIVVTQGRAPVDPPNEGSTQLSTASVSGGPATEVDDGDVTSVSNDEPFPNAAETRLVGLVPPEFQPSCERGADEDRPRYVHIPGSGPFDPDWITDPARSQAVPVAAAIACRPFGSDAPDELAFWTITSPAVAVTELLLNIAGTRQATVGPCDGELPAQEAWSIGPVSGFRACLLDPATIYWTYDGADVLARATREDGDMGALLAWWNEEARLRQP